MIKFDQPADYRFRGRTIWINPSEVIEIHRAENWDQSVIKLRNGNVFTVACEQDEAAKRVNAAMKDSQ